MKIIQIFPGKVWGGAEQYILDLGRALEARGHDVSFLTRIAPAVTERLDGKIKYTSARFGGLFDSATTRFLAEMIHDADIVHIHDISFAPIAVRARNMSGSKARIILTRHIARASHVLPWRVKAVRGLDGIIFVSKLARDLWTTVNPYYPADRCFTVHNTIPPYKPSATAPDLRKLYGIAPDVPIVMYTGRVRKSKGCGVLLDALIACKDLPWFLIYVGACKPGNYSDKLMERARQAGVEQRVRFYGFSPEARVLAAQTDIGVMPSIVREAFGLSAIEFMQMGKCLITTTSGAQPEYITHGVNGLLTQPGSVESLAQALRHMLSYPDARYRAGVNAARSFDSSMSYDHFVDSILSIYQNQS